MNKLNLWREIKQIREDGFSPEGLHKLELYAELFNEGKLLYQRFSPSEQHGCTTGGGTHVIATLLAGAEVATGGYVEGGFPDFQTELQSAKKQIEIIKAWAIKQGVWFKNTEEFLNHNIGEMIAEGGEASNFIILKIGPITQRIFISATCMMKISSNLNPALSLYWIVISALMLLFSKQTAQGTCQPISFL